MSEREVVRFENIAGVERQSDKAILVTVKGKKVWIPKSEIHDDSEVYSVKNGTGTLIISEWIAKQKGLA